eukprot:gene18744-26518_t
MLATDAIGGDESISDESGEAVAAGESQQPGDDGQRTGRRQRRRGPRDEGSGPAEDRASPEQRAEESAEASPREPDEPREPPVEVGEVFAQVLSGEFDVEPPVDEAAAPIKRVLRPEPEAPKLHKVLAQSGIGSRRDMEQAILDGLVEVNGQVAHTGQRIAFGDQIKVNGAARSAGVKPLIGADVWLEPEGSDRAPSRLLLLVQNRMADLLLEVEQARSAVINAAAAMDSTDRAERERALSAAKVTMGRIGALVAEESIQLHGGIGMTWELPLSHYAKRLVMTTTWRALSRWAGAEAMEQPQPLLQRREGAVLVLSNNNPAARNALSPAFYAALTEALAQAEADPT